MSSEMSGIRPENEVFISYSRANQDFAEQLAERLKAKEIDPWLDEDDIPKGVEWWAEIQRGIVGAHAFIFVMSRASLQSMVCHWELAYAIANGKKLIPVLLKDAEQDLFKDQDFLRIMQGLEWGNPAGKAVGAWANFQKLQNINVIFSTSDEQQLIDELVTALRTDYDYLREHTRFAVRAAEWEGKGRKNAFVLRGGDLSDGKAWLVSSQGKEPQPSTLQREYLAASLKANRARTRAFGLTGIAVFIVVAILAVLFLNESQARVTQQSLAETRSALFLSESRARVTQQSLAESQSALSLARQFAAQSSEVLQNSYDPETATLLAIASLNVTFTQEGDMALRAAFPQLPVMYFKKSNSPIAVYSPDGQYIVSIEDGIIVLRDASTGQGIRSFGHHEDRVWDIAVSPDSLYVLTASGTAAWIWDISTGQLLHTLTHAEEVQAAAWSPDGQFVLTGARDGSVHFWDTVGEELFTFAGESGDSITAVQFSPDGQSIVAAAFDSGIRVWNLQTHQQSLTLPGNAGTESVTFSPDGQYLLSGGWDNRARLWDAETGSELMVFEGHSSRPTPSGAHVIDGIVKDVAFSPDGSYVLTGSADFTARLWRTSSGQTIRVFPHETEVTTAVFSPDGRYILTSSGNTVRQWRMNSAEPYVFQVLMVGYDPEAITAVAYSPDGQYVVSIDGGNVAHLWDVETGSEVRSFGPDITSMAFSPDGQYLATGGYHTVHIWNVTEDSPILSLDSGTLYGGNNLEFSPDGHYLLIGEENFARLVDTKTGEEVRVYADQTGFVYSVSFSPDGRYILLGVGSNALMLDVETGQELRAFMGHTDDVLAASFSPDGSYVVTGSSDGTARLWNAETGEEIYQVIADETWVFDVAFSPDGQYVLTGDRDGTARLWSVQTGELVYTYVGHTDWVMGVAFSPDGAYVLTGSRDNTARLWRTHWQDLIPDACSRITLSDLTSFRELYGVSTETPICPQFDDSN
jgi:WD40 repeat protein